MPARISVIVPIHNVAPYLEECLESLAQQTMADLEIVMVDDGSTDASPEIAKRFVARDGRFRLISQANAGLGAARNTGIDEAAGEFIAFADGDDVVPRRAYQRLMGALDRTGSDFASGKVRRLTSVGTTPAVFQENAFERTRLKTHITRFPELVVDRLACNKVFRRSFWNRHGLRFPEGVRNEDIPVVMPAHYLADSVDVIGATVYLWRRRETGDLSGTQRRTGHKALRHRVNAVDHVSRFLADRGMIEAKFLYDHSVLGNDLRYFLDPLAKADDEYRQLFLDLVNDFLDRADQRVLDQPLAIERLKWHLVRRRALPELLEALRFQAENLQEVPPIRSEGQWYGDYPFRGDSRLEIPPSVYRLDNELALVARVEKLRWDDDKLRVEGYAYIDLLGAPRRRSQTVEAVARRSGSQRVVRLRTRRAYRPDITANSSQQRVALDWSGFVATLEGEQLRKDGRWRNAGWEIGISVRSGGVTRSTWQHGLAALHPEPVAERSVDGAHVQARLSTSGHLTVRVRRHRPTVRSYFLDDGVLQLEGDVGSVGGQELALRLRRHDVTLEYPVYVDHSRNTRTFLARVPLGELVREVDVGDPGAAHRPPVHEAAWSLHLAGKGRSQALALGDAALESGWAFAGREIVVQRSSGSGLTVVERSFRPVLTDVKWTPAACLSLRGSFRGPAAEYELVVRSRRDGEIHDFPLRYDSEKGEFAVDVSPASVNSLAGQRPLAAGWWELLVRPRGSWETTGVKLLLGHELLRHLPVSATIGHKQFILGVHGYDLPLLRVTRDLDDPERGGFRQGRLRDSFYPARRGRRIRDVVLYDCFGGREYSDSPRAIHEELVRRGAHWEHLWVVRDGAFRVPESAVPVRELSREYYEAFGRARYVVSNDHWPVWFVRRPEQTCLQTWHGAPLKRHGYDLAGRPKAAHEYRRALRQKRENWQYVVSPGAFATSILERAFPFDGDVIETGLPRIDLLFHPERERATEEVRRRLGVADGKQIVLYAPTYRDHLARRDGYLLGPLLDVAALGAALGDDSVVLFRKHRLLIGSLHGLGRESVLDVSEYPDASELLLIADVLVTDYSSLLFDFAVTGRPLVFFTPDLEAYRDEIRGFSIDFEAVAPGPLLRTTEEAVEALRDPDALAAEFRERREAFVETYCPLDDGHAAARVVDRVFL